VKCDEEEDITWFELFLVVVLLIIGIPEDDNEPNT
jgi:hypothetical protein